MANSKFRNTVTIFSGLWGGVSISEHLLYRLLVTSILLLLGKLLKNILLGNRVVKNGFF